MWINFSFNKNLASKDHVTKDNQVTKCNLNYPKLVDLKLKILLLEDYVISCKSIANWACLDYELFLGFLGRFGRF
jgi:hypothetical protein